MNINRRTFGLGALGAGALFLSDASPFRVVPAIAEPVAQPLPAAHRFQLGEFEITALSDGYTPLGLELFPAADPAVAEAMLTKAFLPPKIVPTSVNAFLLKKGEQTILIDTGAASVMGPSLGHVPEGLAAAGVKPDAIETVIITHLHGDHANGLLAGANNAAFPNAEIVLSKPELAFWTDDGIMSRAPKEVHPFFEAARADVAPYKGKIRQIEGEAEIAPGITAVPAPGHTPGHVLLRISSGDANLLIIIDVIHSAALQFAKPEWAIAFDVDQKQAIETRKKVLDMAAADKMLIAGSHLPFPGFGHVSREGDAFGYIPAHWPSL